MVGNGYPILVLRHERHVWIIDFSFSHFVLPIVDVYPPLPALWTAQVPLITSVYSFCLVGLKTTAHRVEHLLRRRIYVPSGDGDRRAEVNHRRKPADCDELITPA